MDNFSDNVRKLLHNAGWSVDRNIDIGQIVDALIMDGYQPNEMIKSFLNEFGNLEIHYYRGNKNDLIHFDAIKATSDIDPLWIKEYEEKLGGVSLCPIGQAYSNHLTLMIAANGIVYGGYDDNLFFVGQNISEALETIFANQKITEIK